MNPAQRSRKVEHLFRCNDASLEGARIDEVCNDLGEDEIRKALEGLLDDRRLHMSERNRRFLRFVVEEKLAGRAERIKSYSIAVDVFGRASSFDGLTDPIVRIEATRIRAALGAFYQGPGAAERIVFDLPKGGYVPQFHRRAPEVPMPGAMSFSPQGVLPTELASSRRWGMLSGLIAGFALCGALLIVLARPWTGVEDTEAPILGVEPVRSISTTGREGEFAQSLTQSLISNLSRSRGMRLIHLRGATQIPADSAGEALVYRMESTVRMSEDALRFWWSLVDVRSGRTLWSETIDQRQGKLDNVVEDEIAARVAARVIESDGILGVR